MEKRKVKYICFFDAEQNASEKRIQSPAAHQKISFMLSLLTELNYSVDIISPAQTQLKETFEGKEILISNDVKLKLFKTYGKHGLFSLIKRKMLRYRDFKSYLNNTICKDDIIVLYHSMEYLDFFLKFKEKRGFKLILEMEEVYSDANGLSKKTKNKELLLTKKADAFVFPSYSMNSLINKNNVPYIVIHGDYRANRINISNSQKNNYKIVYSGTFEFSKGGVFNALQSAPFLPSNVELYIMGFGTKKQVDKVVSLCTEMQKKSNCKVIYLGCLDNTSCEDFLRNSDIGLCTQNSNAIFNASSFPSKVLTYLKNGLKVVCCKSESLTTSDISNLLFFYDGDAPENIAKAVIKAMNSETNGNVLAEHLEMLRRGSLIKLGELLNNIKVEQK